MKRGDKVWVANEYLGELNVAELEVTRGGDGLVNVERDRATNYRASMHVSELFPTRAAALAAYVEKERGRIANLQERIRECEALIAKAEGMVLEDAA